MFPTSKGWMLVAAVGHSVLFSLMLTAVAHIACLWVGLKLSESVACNLFLVSSLVAGSFSVAAYQRVMRPVPDR